MARKAISVTFCLLVLTGCATAPAPPPGLDTDRLDATGAPPLAVWSPATAPTAVVVGLHGMNDRWTTFTGIGDFLAARGIALYAFDQQGFGVGARWPGSEPLFRDLDQVVRRVRRRHPDAPLFLLGASIGAAVAIRYAAYAQAPPAGLILSAPAVAGTHWPGPFARTLLALGARLLPALRVERPDSVRVAAEELPIPADAPRGVRLDVLHGVVGLMEAARRDAGRVRLPVLVLRGARDKAVPAAAVCELLERLGGERLRVRFYPQGYHLLLRDRDRLRSWGDIARFIAAPSAGGAVALPRGACQEPGDAEAGHET